jgi:hypothetical protein
MINAVVIVAYVCLFLFGVGTALAFLSSWRDGCLRKDLAEVKSGLGWVYLRIENFAQLFFNKAVHNHICSYYMYYGLALILIAVAFSA